MDACDVFQLRDGVKNTAEPMNNEKIRWLRDG